MVLVGDHPASRTRASVASDSSIAGALSRILEQQRPGAPVLEVGEPGPRCALEAGPSAAEAQRDVTNLEAPSRPSRRLALAPTALADFAHCPRRFELVHVDGLPERARGRGAQPEGRSARDGEREEVPLDARLEGTLAHRVLERLDTSSWGSERARAEASALLEGEGVRREHSRHDAIVARVAAFVDSEYARSVAAGGAVLRREHPFVLRVRGAGLELVLGGTMDLLVEWPNGRLDVVDYKRAVGPDLEPYAFQLDVYRLAALARGPEVRAGIVFLGGATQEPLWRTPFEAHALEHELLALAARLAAARASGVFPRVAVPVCEAIHCGFIRRCHPTRSVGSSAEA